MSLIEFLRKYGGYISIINFQYVCVLECTLWLTPIVSIRYYLNLKSSFREKWKDNYDFIFYALIKYKIVPNTTITMDDGLLLESI